MSYWKNAHGHIRMIHVVLCAFAVGFFGFIPGMGLPGAIVLGLSDAALTLLFGHAGYVSLFDSKVPTGIEALFSPDLIWGAAIECTWLWPVSIIAGYVIGFRLLSHKPRYVRWTAFFVTLALWGLLVTAWLTKSIQSQL